MLRLPEIFHSPTQALETSTEIQADEVDAAASSTVVQTSEVTAEQQQQQVASASQVVQASAESAQPAQPAAPAAASSAAAAAATGSMAPADIKEGDVFFALATFVSETGKYCSRLVF